MPISYIAGKMIVDPLGKFLYAVKESSSIIYTYSIDQTTGALTELRQAPAASQVKDIQIVSLP